MLLACEIRKVKKILIRPLNSAPCSELYIGNGLLSSSFLKDFFSSLEGKIIVVADEALKELYAADFAKQIDAELLMIPSGEKAKTQQTAWALLSELFKMKAGRDTTLVALGGGAATDLVGFVASIYLRGISLILIPTTLLGAVDAAIGGKTAIDTSFGKNLVGTIYHPKAIFIDFDTFQTLSEKERFNGLAEILKMGLIYDLSLWEQAKKNEDDDPTLIFKAIEGKIAIIEQDPMEQFLRRILNFGHTIGHALETLAGYRIAHGEAVALGCMVESYLSMRLNYLSEKDFEQIWAIYSRFSLKLPNGYTRGRLLEAMAYDKKKTSGKTRFVLIDKIGHAIEFEGDYCRIVSPCELESTLDWMESTYL